MYIIIFVKSQLQPNIVTNTSGLNGGDLLAFKYY